MQSPDVKDQLVSEVIKDYVWRRRWRLLSWIAISIMTLFAVIKVIASYGNFPVFSDHIAVVDISGEIAQGTIASADSVIPVLKDAFENDKVKLVVLEINSPGGSPSESERISSEIDRLKNKHHKRVVAVIDSLGASAAYMIAVHTDQIVAGRYSLVGSIGVIMTGWDVSKLADKLDVGQAVYRSGRYKDLGNPFRQATDDDKKVLQALVDTAAHNFIEDVQKHRGQKLAKVDLFTGQVWNGSEALKLGLVDQIGTIESLTAEHQLKVNHLGPVIHSGFGASFAHELGAGMASVFVKATNVQLQYSQ